MELQHFASYAYHAQMFLWYSHFLLFSAMTIQPRTHFSLLRVQCTCCIHYLEAVECFTDYSYGTFFSLYCISRCCSMLLMSVQETACYFASSLFCACSTVDRYRRHANILHISMSISVAFFHCVNCVSLPLSMLLMFFKGFDN